MQSVPSKNVFAWPRGPWVASEELRQRLPGGLLFFRLSSPSGPVSQTVLPHRPITNPWHERHGVLQWDVSIEPAPIEPRCHATRLDASLIERSAFIADQYPQFAALLPALQQSAEALRYIAGLSAIVKWSGVWQQPARSAAAVGRRVTPALLIISMKDGLFLPNFIAGPKGSPLVDYIVRHTLLALSEYVAKHGSGRVSDHTSVADRHESISDHRHTQNDAADPCSIEALVLSPQLLTEAIETWLRREGYPVLGSGCRSFYRHYMHPLLRVVQPL